MNRWLIIPLFLMVSHLGLASVQPAQTNGNEPSQQAEHPLNTLTPLEKEYLKTYGWIIGRQSSLHAFGLNSTEIKTFIEGLYLAAQGEPAPTDIQSISNNMHEYLQGKAASYAEQHEHSILQLAAKNKALSEAFFHELSENPGINKTQTGLYYEIIYPGSDKKPTSEDTVTVHYEGRLIDGSVFDSSKERGEPATFSLQRVIAGFTEGLQLVGEGGKIILYMPSELGYGATEIPGIPPGSTLIFDVELIKIKQSPIGSAIKI